MINVLENYTLSVYDIVYKKKYKMRSVSGDSVVLMSGSGPTVFAAASS
jgi:4-diphosphocytidyl-2C-methyl-D-erythritol kinase